MVKQIVFGSFDHPFQDGYKSSVIQILFPPIYKERQHQCCNATSDTAHMKKIMESFQNGLKPHSGVTQLFSMPAVSVPSLQRCYSVVGHELRFKF